MVGRIKDSVVILPTYNEAESLQKLLPALQQYDVDILVVDDSPGPETAEVAASLGVTVIERGLKGRMSALLDGIAVTSNRNIITMDADGQHPPELVPDIIEALNRSDVVVASRYVTGGVREGLTLRRKLVVFVARLLAWPLVPGRGEGRDCPADRPAGTSYWRWPGARGWWAPIPP